MARIVSATLWITAAAVSPALAAGLAVDEQGARASGQAGAWVARADDASANWYNPAALARLPGPELQVGGSLVRRWSGTELVSGDAAFGLDPQSPTTFESSSTTLAPFHVYYAHPLNDRFAWGVALNTPFSLDTEWTRRPVTFSAQESELATVQANVNAAWAFDETWSVGVGLDYLRADLSAHSREVPVDLDADPTTFEIIGRSDLTGDGGDVGFNVGVLYTGRGWSAGLAYRSQLSPRLDGDLKFRDFGAVQSFFPDSPARVDLDLPAHAAVGIAWQAADVWTFEFDLSWAQWSSFEAWTVDVQQEQGLVQDVRERQDWDDTIAYRLGAVWRFTDVQEARVGLLQDDDPVPDETARPSIPDSRRWALSLGYGYLGETWNVDAYVMPVFHDDRRAAGSNAEGVLDGTYRSDALLGGVSVRLRF